MAEKTTAVRSSTYAADSDAVEKRLCDMYGRYRLTNSRTTMRDDIVQTPTFMLNRVAFTGTAEMALEIPSLTLGIASGGEYRWHSRDERGDATRTAFIIRPRTRLSVRITDSEVFGVSFDAEALRRTARLMYADDRLALDFDSSTPTSAEAERYLREAGIFTVDMRQMIFESELLASAVYRQIAVSVLELFPLRGDPVERRATTAALLAGYRRAAQYISDFASLPITVEDIAEAAGLPAHQLDAAFQSYSPSGSRVQDELRRTRLDAAHVDLVTGDPSRGDSVREIALRWGFTPSGLARDHRRTYGTKPQATLES